MSNCQQEICFFIGQMKFYVDENGGLRQFNGEKGMVFGRLVGFIDPKNQQNKSSWPVKGWQVTIANQEGREFTFDQVITVILSRRSGKDQRRYMRPIATDQREHGPDRRQQVA